MNKWLDYLDAYDGTNNDTAIASLGSRTIRSGHQLGFASVRRDKPVQSGPQTMRFASGEENIEISKTEHIGTSCAGCAAEPILGSRFRCMEYELFPFHVVSAKGNLSILVFHV